MVGKLSIVCFVVTATLGVPGSAWSQRWSRADCTNAVHQKLGTYSADSGRGTLSRSAIRRCIKYGPGAIE
jgi:hypothetical protein